MKSGKKENPKPLVDKVAEAKPVDDAVGKVSEKPPIQTETAPPPQPKVEEKPVEKKPDPPKPVAEKPKEEPKPEKKQEPPKVDPIAEALKKEQAAAEAATRGRQAGRGGAIASQGLQIRSGADPARTTTSASRPGWPPPERR